MQRDRDTGQVKAAVDREGSKAVNYKPGDTWVNRSWKRQGRILSQRTLQGGWLCLYLGLRLWPPELREKISVLSYQAE